MPWFSFFECWVLSQLFHSLLSLSSSFTFISALKIVSSAYLRLLIFFPTILTPAYPVQHFTWCTLHMSKISKVQKTALMYSLSAYRLLRRKLRWSGIPISLKIFHSLLLSTESKALSWSVKQYMFCWKSLAFCDPMDVGNLISGSSAFSKSSLNIWKFSVHILLKPCLENFEHYFASAWDECNCAVVWAFFGIAFLWDWNEIWPLPVLWPLLGFPNLLVYWV